MKRWIAATLAAAALSAMTPAVATADPIGGCERVAWGFLGLTQKRTICDGPRRPDGSWERHRRIWTPAGYVSGSSYCGYYSCSFSQGYYRDESTQELLTYIVFDDNVPPGEPGWLPPGTANILG